EYYLMNIYGKEASAYYDLHQGLRVLKRGGKTSTPVPAEKNDTLVEELEEFMRAVRGDGAPEKGRRASHRVARGDPRRNPLGARGPSRGGEGDPGMRKTLLLLAAFFALSANGQEAPFPQRSPIEITVLFPAGTSADVTARMLADG